MKKPKFAHKSVDLSGVEPFVDAEQALQRWAEPAELAGAVIFLVSDASSYVNGQILTIDGGASVRLFPMDERP